MVRPEKDPGGQEFFKFFECFARGHRSMVPEMKGCVIATCFQVDDIADIEERNTRQGRDGDLMKRVFPQYVLLQRYEFFSGLSSRLTGDPRYGGSQYFDIDRFQQVIECRIPDRPDRILIIGGGEYEVKVLFRQAAQHPKTIHPRHLDIEEYDMGLMLFDQENARFGVIRFMDNGYFRAIVLYFLLERQPAFLLVIDDNGG